MMSNPNLSSLSTELLEYIFDYIYESSPPTLSALILVNRTFNRSARKFKNRHQTFTYYKEKDDSAKREKTPAYIHELLTNPIKREIVNSIRHITVDARACNCFYKASLWTPRALQQKWEPLANLVARIPYLKTFTFGGGDQMPSILLEKLEKHHPRSHLYIRDWERVKDDEDHNNAAELALSVSPLLRSIQATIGLVQEEAECDLRWDTLRRIVALSPNLEAVDIDTRSCERPSRDSLSRKLLEKGFQEHRILQSKAAINILKSFRTRGDNLWYDPDLGFVGDTLDVARLETLDVEDLYSKVYRGDENRRSQPQLPTLECLKHLSISNKSGHQDAFESIEEILVSCPALETLELTGRRGQRFPLSIIFRHHGDSLKKLALHHIEAADSDDQPTFTLDEIATINVCCPNLEDITIDIAQFSTPEHVQSVLEALAQFSELSIVRLYIPLGIAEQSLIYRHIYLDEIEQEAEENAHRKNPYSPLRDPQWLEKVWLVLRDSKKKYGTRQMKELHVKIGEWEREIGTGFNAGWAVWEASHRRYFIARPGERDDRPDELQVCERSSWGSRLGENRIVKLPDKVVWGASWTRQLTESELRLKALDVI